MSTTRDEDLDARLRQLESRLVRRARTWAALFVGTAVLLVGSCVAARKDHVHPDELRLRRLVIVDGTGQERIVLGELAEPADPGLTRDGDDRVGISAYDAHGIERLAIGALPRLKTGQRRSTGFALIIFDAEGIERGAYATSDDGAALITVDHKGHRDAAAMFAWPDGSCGFTAIDPSPMGRVNLGVLEDGTSRLAIWGPDGRLGGHLKVTEDGGASLELIDGDGGDLLVEPD